MLVDFSGAKINLFFGMTVKWYAVLYEVLELMYEIKDYFLPVIIFRIPFPIFHSKPVLEVGTPVNRATFCFRCVIPRARFHENDRPGIGVDFLAISQL